MHGSSAKKNGDVQPNMLWFTEAVPRRMVMCNQLCYGLLQPVVLGEDFLLAALVSYVNTLAAVGK